MSQFRSWRTDRTDQPPNAAGTPAPAGPLPRIALRLNPPKAPVPHRVLRRMQPGVASDTPGDRPSIADQDGGLLSRRNFLYGAVGAGAVAVAAGGGAAIYFATKGKDVDLDCLKVANDDVTSLTDLTLVEDSSTKLSLYGNIELPLGSLVWCNSRRHSRVCILPTDTGKHLAKVGLIMLGSTTYSVVLDQAVGSAEGFEIYDVRASSSSIVWTEANVRRRRLARLQRRYQKRQHRRARLGRPKAIRRTKRPASRPSVTTPSGRSRRQQQTFTTNDKPNTELSRESRNRLQRVAVPIHAPHGHSAVRAGGELRGHRRARSFPRRASASRKSTQAQVRSPTPLPLRNRCPPSKLATAPTA